MRRPVGDDRGSATIWVLACSVLVVAVALAVTLRACAVLARHRAETAADLAALAAAGRIGVADGACAAAGPIAAANGATLLSCRVELAPDGRSGTVDVRVSVPVRLPVAGAGRAAASARAGRLPGSPRVQPREPTGRVRLARSTRCDLGHGHFADGQLHSAASRAVPSRTTCRRA